MKYFDKDFLDFFKELAANNHKEWFDQNRTRYEKSVKEPFKKFVSDLILEVAQLDSSVTIDATDAIFRINRDIRFSKDKTPYKLTRSAIISSAGRKDHSIPGFYISLGPEFTSLGGGAYFMKPEQLQNVRTYIVNHMHAFDKAIKSNVFKESFGELQGEENKRLPKEFQEFAQEQPLLYKKQMYFMQHHDPELILKDHFMDFTLQQYRAALPVHQFLSQALG